MKNSLCHVYNYYTYKDIDLKNKKEKKEAVSLLKSKVNREMPNCFEKAQIMQSIFELESQIVEKKPRKNVGDLHH